MSARGVLALRPGLPDRIGAIAAGDFNADGRTDILMANFEAGDVSLFEDDGAGGYVERGPSPFLVLGGPSFIATSDLNFPKDGRTDAVIVDRLGRAVSPRTSDPLLTLKASANLLVGRLPQAVAIADFGTDMKPDLAVTSQRDDLIYLFSGHGDGNFSFLRTVDPRTPQQIADAKPVGVYGIVAGDFNSDGKVDLFVTERDAPLPAPLPPPPAGGLAAVLLGKGDGTFQSPKTVVVGRHPTFVVTARLNDDPPTAVCADFLDLVVLFEGGKEKPTDPPSSAVPAGVSTLLGKGDGTFNPGTTLDLGTSSQPVQIAAGDLLGLGVAGFDDVAVVNFGAEDVLLFPADGAGGFMASNVQLGGSGSGSSLRSPSGVVLLDLLDSGGIPGADGVADHLAIANYGGYSFTLFEPDLVGPKPYKEAPISPVTATRHPIGMELNTLDAGIGDDALVLSDGNPSLNPFIAFNDGFFFKDRGTPLPAGSGPLALSLGDFSRDGILDVALALSDIDDTDGSITTPGVAILKGNANGTFSSGSGLCSGGANAGKSCTSTSSCPGASCSFSLAFGTCAGGTNAGKSCAVPADCPSGSCALPLPPIATAAPATALLVTDLNSGDADQDGVPDSVDNCPARYNPAQTNTRGRLCSGGTNQANPCNSDVDCPGGSCSVLDLIGDDCDSASSDCDGDGLADKVDNCPDVYNRTQTDSDANRAGDACDHLPDLVAVETSAGQLEIRSGLPGPGPCQPGLGFFSAAALIPVGSGPTGVVSGAFSGGDNNSDLVVTLHDGAAFRILAGDGSGNFSLKGCAGGASQGRPCAGDSDCPSGTCIDLLETIPGTQPGALTDLDANPDDLDLDGVPNRIDNCPTRYNPPDPGCGGQQCDADQDGLGDACSQVEDPDGDLVLTRLESRLDNCPDVYNPSQADADLDGIGDACDSNPSVYNPNDDEDLDGVVNATDDCPTRYNPPVCSGGSSPGASCASDTDCPGGGLCRQLDTSGNGVGDACDELADPDLDGILTAKRIQDNCPDTYNPPEARCNGRQCDTNFDGIGDACQVVRDLAIVDEAAPQVLLRAQLLQIPPPAHLVPLPSLPLPAACAPAASSPST